MKKDYYQLKEIILGLREEYIKTANELKELNKYLILDRRLNKVNIELKSNKRLVNFIDEYKVYYQHDLDKNNVYLKYYAKKTKLNQLITTIKDYITRSTSELSNYLKEYPTPYFKGAYKVSIENPQKFITELNEIRKNNFSKNISREIRRRDKSYTLSLEPSLIIFKSPNINIQYIASEDSIFITNINNQKINTNELLEKYLNQKIPYDLLSPFHQETIDTNIDTKKEIIIPTLNKKTNKLILTNKNGKILLKDKNNEYKTN